MQITESSPAAGVLLILMLKRRRLFKDTALMNPLLVTHVQVPFSFCLYSTQQWRDIRLDEQQSTDLEPSYYASAHP